MTNCNNQSNETTNEVTKKKINKWYLDSRYDAVAALADLPAYLEIENESDFYSWLSVTNYGRQTNALEKIEDCELKKVFEILAMFNIVKFHCRTTGHMWFVGYPETTHNAVCMARWVHYGSTGAYQVFTTNPDVIPEDMVGDVFTLEDDLVRLFRPMVADMPSKEDVKRIQSIAFLFDDALETPTASKGEGAEVATDQSKSGTENDTQGRNRGRGADHGRGRNMSPSGTAVAEAMRQAGIVR